METIPERGQTTCLLKENHLTVLYALGGDHSRTGAKKLLGEMARTALFERTTGQEPSSQQAFRLPPFWNGLQHNPSESVNANIEFM